jgi:HsdM N-terminal domain
MLTGDIRNQVDLIWDTFWTGGISNPLEVIEQLTYLLFIKRLDEVQTRAENLANRTGKPVENATFPEGTFKLSIDGEEKEITYQDLRWSILKNKEATQQYQLITGAIFPFIRNLGGSDSAFAKHIKDARFTLPPEKAGLLARVIDMLELGVGRAHNLHLSSLEGFTLPGDTSSVSRYWDEDIVEPVLDAKNGIQKIPEGAGIGVTLKKDLIEKFTARKQIL